MSHRPLSVGIDFGATKVRAAIVEAVPAGVRVVADEERVYRRVDAFVPLSLEQQERERSAPGLSRPERLQAERWIEAAVDAVGALTGRFAAAERVIGVAAPGVKTPDGRGTCVVRNGPRIPDLLDRLVAGLGASGARVSPATLLGDGECSVWGEAVHVEGALRGVANGYYLGGGTGLAEGLWDGSSVRPCEPRAWQLPCDGDASFEARLGMDALRAEFGEFPDVLFQRGDARASTVFAEVAQRTSRLLALRATPETEALVLGQRFGEWFLREDLEPCFRRPLLQSLEQLASARTAHAVRGSRLRVAPAVGCAWLALQEALAC